MPSTSTTTLLSRSLCLVSCLCAAAIAAEPTAAGPTADQARQRLAEGNQRYVKGSMKACGASNHSSGVKAWTASFPTAC